MTTMRRAGWGLLAAVTVAACSSPPPKADQGASETATSAVTSKPAEPTSTGVTITAVKWPELQAAIAAQKGKVVVMDCWADY
jgi:hypothetical protein